MQPLPWESNQKGHIPILLWGCPYQKFRLCLEKLLRHGGKQFKLTCVAIFPDTDAQEVGRRAMKGSSPSSSGLGEHKFKQARPRDVRIGGGVRQLQTARSPYRIQAAEPSAGSAHPFLETGECVCARSIQSMTSGYDADRFDS